MSADDLADRGILSSFDRRKPGVRVAMLLVHVLLILGLVVAGLGPLLWLAKAAVTPTQDSISTPMLLWPNGIDWANITAAWVEVEVGKYFVNTLVLAAGSLVFALLIATTGGYVLSVLRPRYAPVLNAAVLATLFIPSVVLLVPLYLTVVRPAIGPSLLNNYLAVWLPTAANAFNILLVKRFFDNLPREVFEAARTDGGGRRGQQVREHDPLDGGEVRAECALQRGQGDVGAARAERRQQHAQGEAGQRGARLCGDGQCGGRWSHGGSGSVSASRLGHAPGGRKARRTQ